MKHSAILAFLGLGATLASAHMEMIEPPPFRSKVNTHATQKDFDMTSPLAGDGSNFPCKGYISDFGTPAGASVATYSPGQSYKFTISGGASHNGGSCQASLSYDKGKTWTVIHSYIGNCPLQGESSFDFTIPADTPSGEAIFSWSWFNKVGNREMYQNCAAVTIGGGKSKRAASESFKSRPAMFVANLGNGCGTIEGKDLVFPDPGPDVTSDSTATAPPTGSCSGGPGGGSSGGSDGGIPTDGAGAGAPPAQPTPEKPSATIPGGVFITSPQPQQPEQPPSTEEPPATPAPTPGNGSGAAGAMPQGQACTNEGDWNCVGGSQFQRCASGQWSALIPMAAGTTCQEGISSTFGLAKERRNRALRFARSLRF
ncbi:hypothetical protein NLU13_6420 [Sarocladium strictum]|uniref:Extracellular protein n=1 Tax=Sarocladium strictum TaxID=5046 RepID=A0AA39L7A1_SARSR|nr:hypothetical protein NLU13_6420 [Sarocladium strictum]